MKYRICKSFEVESGHMLSKHPDRCRFPHGHSRRVDVVLSAERLDANDMVCDFASVRKAVAEHIDRLDHAMAVNTRDPNFGVLRGLSTRVVAFDGVDPTTEVLARDIYAHVERLAREGVFGPGVTVERVRISETSTSWAEYGI
jgi:6-pyruvoyltetrahydropterin/6-carboxytetrahydropterin synthase